jgi:tetratricopeptide (TPR) repeat protein
VQTHNFLGDHERVVELATDNLAALPADSVYERFGNSMPISIYDRGYLVRSLSELGRFAEAAEYATEALRLAEPTQQMWPVGWAHFAAGMSLLLKGDCAKARSSLEHAIAAYRTGNISLSLPGVVALSAWALAQLGEAKEAMPRLSEGEQLLERSAATGIGTAAGYRWLGRAALLLGRLDDARRLGDRAVPAKPGTAAHAHEQHLLGDIATHPDRFDAASGAAHYREALAIARLHGMRPLVAHCHFGLARLYRRIGETEHVRENLIAATMMYREMEMGFWLTQVGRYDQR